MTSSTQAESTSNSSQYGFLNEDRKTPHKYTDFVITCEGDAFHVHSIILRPQSEYFDKIMDQEGLWKESQDRRIELSDEDARSMWLFLELLYEPAGTEFNLGPHSDNYDFYPYDLIDLAKMYILADKYDAPSVQDKTTRIVERLKRESRLSAYEITKALEVVYDPDLSEIDIPRHLFQCSLFERMHKDVDGSSDRLDICLEGTPLNKEGDFVWMMIQCSEHVYFCPSCKHNNYSGTEIITNKCLRCGHTGIIKTLGAAVSVDESIFDSVKGKP